MTTTSAMSDDIASQESGPIVVTGGCGILGSVLCHELVEAGSTVVIVDTIGADPSGLASSINGAPGTAHGLAIDLADISALGNFGERVVDIAGVPTGLVNAAASKGPDLEAFLRPVETYMPETWRDVMTVNTDAMFFVSRELGSRMATLGRGSIVNIASVYGHLAPDQRIYEGSEYEGLPISSPAVYSAAKGAVLAMTRHLASWWGTDNVRVNAVSPGGIYSGQNAAFVEKYSERVPMGRMAQTHEVTSVIRFLLSAGASYMTGQNLCVDGGLSCW